MNHLFSLLATAIVCACVTGCQSSAVSEAQERQVALLEIRAPFESVSYHVEGRTCTVQEVGLNGRVLSHTERKLSDDESTAFWTGLEELKVKEWRRDYGVETGDGSRPPTVWKLATQKGRKSTSSQGIGTFPGDEQPKEPSGETSRRFHTLYSLFQNTTNPPTAQVAAQVTP